MSQKTKMLNRIIHYLILNASFIRDLGLLDGKMGICIFFYLYARQTGSKLYEELGFKNIYDYASDEFGIARGTVSNWLMVASNFGVLNSDTGFYSLDERLKDFSITQLVLVRQLNC